MIKLFQVFYQIDETVIIQPHFESLFICSIRALLDSLKFWKSCFKFKKTIRTYSSILLKFISFSDAPRLFLSFSLPPHINLQNVLDHTANKIVIKVFRIAMTVIYVSKISSLLPVGSFKRKRKKIKIFEIFMRLFSNFWLFINQIFTES